MTKKPSYVTHWRRWRYKNTTLLVLSLVVFFYLARTSAAHEAVNQLGGFGYIGAFITGIFFVSTFTVAPAALVLFNLAENLHPLEVALLAGLGAMLGDFLVLRLVQGSVFDELTPILGKLQPKYVRNLFKTPYFAWLLPVIGAVVIASPLPDEAGVSLLGLSRLKKWQFFAVTYVLNVAGIFVIVTLARA
ncbi:MAG: hypothetical protein ABIQ89_03055 [Candidatus Saccharimonadales bacterium]